MYLETFARPLWGLTSLLAGGDDYAGLDRWVKGFASGTDPKGEEYWGESRAKDQRMVEMSPLSFAIALKPDVFYDVSLQVLRLIGTLTGRLKPTKRRRTSLPSWRRASASRCLTVRTMMCTVLAAS